MESLAAAIGAGVVSLIGEGLHQLDPETQRAKVADLVRAELAKAHEIDPGLVSVRAEALTAANRVTKTGA
jgi:hypothetical protein